MGYPVRRTLRLDANKSGVVESRPAAGRGAPRRRGHAESSVWFVAQGWDRAASPIVWRYFNGEWERFDVPGRRYSEYLFTVAATSDSEVWIAGYRIAGDRPYSYAARLTEPGFVYVPGDDMAYWSIDLDQTGGVWAGGEAGPARILRAC